MLTKESPISFNIGDITGGDDCHGHGTHVDSIAAGSSVGVASGAGIYSIRISDICTGRANATNSNVIAAFDYVVSRVTQDSQMYPIIDNAVLNFSYSSSSGAVESSMDRLVQNGVVVATSAGNDNESACNPSKPPSFLIVGGSNENDSRWVDSNHGSCVSLLAPGEDVLGAEQGVDDGYIDDTGTSARFIPAAYTRNRIVI